MSSFFLAHGTRCAVAALFLSLCHLPPVFAASDASHASPSYSARYHCVPAPDVIAPEPLLPDDDYEPDFAGAAPLCPEGEVPQPVPSRAPKGRPGLAMVRVNSSTYNYHYAGTFQSTASAGLSASLTQHAPRLGRADYHSLTELAASSSDGANFVEVGWTVDLTVNGDLEPHLFVYTWINQMPGCYNGCGWVQVSRSRYPGMPVEVSEHEGESHPYAIAYKDGSWWVSYQNEWIGYFPSSLWSGRFTQAGLAHWFGEVSSSRPYTCSDMGTGERTSSDDAAVVKKAALLKSDLSPSTASPVPYVTRERFYDVTSYDYSTGSFGYGGPGGC